MTIIEKNIVNAYLVLFESLSSSAKNELFEKLKSSFERKKEKTNLSGLERSFGAWESELSAEEMVKEIRESRRFREKDLKL